MDAAYGPAPIVCFDVLDSTNAEARRRAEAGEAGPLWIAAVRQTEGRGRRGRGWETGEGNLAATLLTTTDRSPAESAQLSFVMALAVADLVSSIVPASIVRVKWPNDVMVEDAKVAGILIESGPVAAPSSEAVLWLAIGVGVNLATSPETTERPATGLSKHLCGELTAPPTPEQALGTLADAFGRWAGLWVRQGFAPIRAAWLGRAYRLGRPCTVRLDRETLEGIAEDLDANGALVVRLPRGEVRRVSAGDVFFDLAHGARG